jgi:hypothetical protein
MATQAKVYDSGPEQPDDEFWLAQGRKMVEDSLPAVREAAKALMTGLGVLQGIYVAILGFGDLAKNMSPPAAGLFALPLLAWLIAMHSCLSVMKTKERTLNLFSPEEIRGNHEQTLKDKQQSLTYAFWELTVGLDPGHCPRGTRPGRATVFIRAFNRMAGCHACARVSVPCSSSQTCLRGCRHGTR